MEKKDLKPAGVFKYFEEICQVPRPSKKEEKMIAYLKAFGAKHNLETKVDEAGNVLIKKPATPGKENLQTVVLQSHIDMVCEKNNDVQHDFLTDPIETEIDGEWLKAKGTTLGADNGIGVATELAILADDSIEHGPLECLFTVDEETGLTGAFALQEGFMSGDILLNLDSEDEGEIFIGCAGGIDSVAEFTYKEVKVPAGYFFFKVEVKGLKGGHSGVDIHLGRANANKLMFRFLKEAVRDYGARLSSVDGGSLRNAIPREAFAVITIPGDNVEALWELVSDYQEMYRYEYKGIEHNINFTAEMTDMPATLIPEEIQDDLINAIEGCQNGVISMLVDFPGTVESSTNLAIVKSSNEMIEIQILVRSSSESRKEAVCSSLESIFSLAGAKVEYSDGYGGWQPNIDSPILKIMQQAYLDLYGKKPEAKVMHAGLECGIIQESYPDMDMISIGPDLQHPHSPDERVSIPSVARTWDFIVTTLARI